jgi:hypothetical protein
VPRNYARSFIGVHLCGLRFFSIRRGSVTHVQFAKLVIHLCESDWFRSCADLGIFGSCADWLAALPSCWSGFCLALLQKR